MLIDAAEIAVLRYREERGEQGYLSKRQVYAKRGRGVVDRLVRQGELSFRKDGDKNHKSRIPASEVEAVMRASNYESFYKKIL